MFQPLQFRDLIGSVEDEFFGRVIEVKATKGDVGIILLADYMMTFPSVNAPQWNPMLAPHVEEFPSHLLEIFF